MCFGVIYDMCFGVIYTCNFTRCTSFDTHRIHVIMIYLPTFTMKKINHSCIGKETSVPWKFMGYKNEHLRESQVFGAHLVCRIPHRVVVDSGRGTFGQSLALFAPQLLRSEGPGGGKMGNPVASRILNLSTLQTFEKMTLNHHVINLHVRF